MRWKVAPAMLALMLIAAACSSGPYTIEEFTADTGCTADGMMEVSASGSARAVGDIEYNMISAGLPSAWCEGMIHRLLDGAEISGYVFNSEAGDPLEFEVTRDGYAYMSGTGSVTDPDGGVTDLP